jgi:hypothetical protein
MTVSPHCTLAEATRSQTATRLGLDNTPAPAVLTAMQSVAEHCFEPARRHFGPVRVSSFYRSPALNAAIGGSATSDHCLGRAIDLDADGSTVTNAALFGWLRERVPFDQLIWEFGDTETPAWVHVSYREGANRGQVLRAVHRPGGGTVYEVMT